MSKPSPRKGTRLCFQREPYRLTTLGPSRIRAIAVHGSVHPRVEDRMSIRTRRHCRRRRSRFVERFVGRFVGRPLTRIYPATSIRRPSLSS